MTINMRRNMHCALRGLLSILGVCYATFASAADVPTMSCLFEAFIDVNHEAPVESRRTPIQQSMRIVLGRTDEATLKLDGAKRATNSRTWMPIQLPGWETWETQFVGDFREMLSLAHELGANKKPLNGWYKASLVSTGVHKTHIFLGNCLVE